PGAGGPEVPAAGSATVDVTTTDAADPGDPAPEVAGPRDDGATSPARRILTFLAGALLLLAIAGHVGVQAMAGAWSRR
ncbi:MAG: hypothetical protein ACRDUY_06175, partial [Nitriliruptorales bacterium]